MITRMIFGARILGGVLALVLIASSIAAGLLGLFHISGLEPFTRMTVTEEMVLQWSVLLVGGVVGLMAAVPVDYGDALFADQF